MPSNSFAPAPKRAPPPTPTLSAQQLQAYDAVRKQVAAELLSTEHTYVESLSRLCDSLLAPLNTALARNQPILVQHEIDAIFGNVALLREHHEAYEDVLRQRISAWTSDTLVGDLFATDLANFINVCFLFYFLKKKDLNNFIFYYFRNINLIYKTIIWRKCICTCANTHSRVLPNWCNSLKTKATD